MDKHIPGVVAVLDYAVEGFEKFGSDSRPAA